MYKKVALVLISFSLLGCAYSDSSDLIPMVCLDSTMTHEVRISSDIDPKWHAAIDEAYAVWGNVIQGNYLYHLSTLDRPVSNRYDCSFTWSMNDKLENFIAITNSDNGTIELTSGVANSHKLNVTLHEIGHSLGLHHPVDDDPVNANVLSVMQPGSPINYLTCYDKKKVCALWHCQANCE